MDQDGFLDDHERRVLGVLLEKEQTTPDAYPLTVNALVAGCNQRSNREPVLALTETEVVEALDRLRREVLVWRTEGPRAEKWQHSVGHRWHLSPRRKALLTLLLLRGAQTPGELKSRSERMTSFESVSQLEETLAEMAEGPEALVRLLPREPGQRGRRWTHTLAPQSEKALEPPSAPVFEDHTDETDPGRSAGERLRELEVGVAKLTAEVESIAAALARLQEDLGLEDAD